MEAEKEITDQYAVVEMMGHRKVVGIISESKLGPGSLIRVDVLGSNGEIERTEHIGVGSVYCLTEVTEEVAKKAAAAYTPKPSFAYALNPAPSYDPHAIDGDDY